MILYGLLSLLIAVNFSFGEEGLCCPVKVVNGIQYDFLGHAPELSGPMNCPDDCIYESLSFGDKLFCFKPGPYEVKCLANFTEATPVNCQCGRPAPTSASGRIINGKNTKTDVYPWFMVLLFSWIRNFDIEDPVCGASLITQNWAITAAHCVFTKIHGKYRKVYSPWMYQLVLGENERKKDGTMNTNLLKIGVTDYFKPTNSPDEKGDMALLRLKQPVDVNKFPTPCLPLPNKDRAFWVSHTATAIGYGQTNADVNQKPHYPDLLQEGKLTIIDPTTDRCLNLKDIICAGITEQTTCYGDSGGPFMVMQGGSQLLVGLVQGGSLTPSDCSVSQIAFFTSIGYWMEWINDIIGTDARCRS